MSNLDLKLISNIACMSQDASTLSENELQLFDEFRESLFQLALKTLPFELAARRAVRRTLIDWIHADRSAIPNNREWLLSVCNQHAEDISSQVKDSSSMEQYCSELACKDSQHLQEKSHGNWWKRFLAKLRFPTLLPTIAEGFAVCGSALYPVIVLNPTDFRDVDKDSQRDAQQ